ncbi:MAG: Lrp/AsnC ligand binding domain-containing protein [Chitinivibrionales bacterium]
MVNALILLNVDRDKVNDVAEKLSEIEGVSEVYSVAGRYDLAVVVRAKDNDHLADLVTGTLLRIEGIQKSETLFAFRVYSKHDLDRMFSI